MSRLTLTDDDYKQLAAEFDRVPDPRERLAAEDYAAELERHLPPLDPVAAKRLAAVRANLGLAPRVTA